MQLTQILHRMVQQRPSDFATIDGPRSRSWGDVTARVARYAGALRGLGVQPGDRVALMARNSDRFFDYLFATWWAGGVINPVNLRWSPREIGYSLENCATRVLLLDPEFEPLVPAIRADAPGLEHVRLVDTAEHESWITGAEPVPDCGRSGDDLAAILYTGGTTGFPKGVMLSHRNLLASALGVLAMPGCRATDRYLHTAPMFHVGALSGVVIASLSSTTHVFAPVFDPVQVLGIIETHQVTEVFLVPTMIRMLIDHPDFARFDVRCLKKIRYGASTIDEVLLGRALEAFPGVSFIQAYGMTELSPVATILTPADHVLSPGGGSKINTAGRATPVISLRIVDDNDETLEPGVIGEIVARGETMMRGYWGMPEATAEALRSGWMHTGDAGFIDEQGYITVVDRIKDMIISGGENIYSAEVENALASYPGVKAVAVVGVPDEKWGEKVHAVIVPHDAASLEEADLTAHVRGLIAGYKVPRSYAFVEEMPLSAAGKISKVELRRMFSPAA